VSQSTIVSLRFLSRTPDVDGRAVVPGKFIQPRTGENSFKSVYTTSRNFGEIGRMEGINASTPDFESTST